MTHFSKIKSRLLATLATAAILTASNTALAQQSTQNVLELGNSIAAVVEGRIITVQELRRELNPIIPRIRAESRNQQEFNSRISQISREVLQNMIDRIIIVDAANEDGILIPQSYIDQEYDEVLENDFGGDRAKFIKYLKTQSLTPRDYRKQIYERIVVSVMRQQNRKSQSEISPERIEDFYVINKPRFYQSESMHLRQIILSPVASETPALLNQTAKKIISELDSGANFGDTARKYSQDEMSRNGGDWGWIERSDLRKELSNAAFELQPGDYSQPIELGGTIFILFCEDKREEMIQPISAVRDIIENVLVGEIARETQERWLENLREQAYIRYYL